jgi:hypothetical protein
MTHNHDVAFFTTYFSFSQIGYAKHARAFRTQIDLNKKMQTNLGDKNLKRQREFGDIGSFGDMGTGTLF